MDNIKNDRYYLDKILADLEHIMRITDGKTQSEIERDEILTDSVMFRLIQIAENSEKLTREFKEANAGIPWRAIKGMRNTIVHNYGIVDLSVIYDTVTKSIPEFYNQLKKLLIEV